MRPKPVQVLTEVETLIREALTIWEAHGQKIDDEALPTMVIAHLAGNGYIIQPMHLFDAEARHD